ncbi:MAG: S-methyl-5'-thioadenosine phosphorylase [Armatimonadetes bacterium]|nr:S-methyl-5'-thioadenosine phosphorylase [Armatimonadota bacterium]
MASAEIGVFGGSGFYTFLEHVEEVTVETPYGAPSDMITIGDVAGRRVAFLPRHNRRHHVPPHMINYRANLYAMKALGVTRIIAPTAAGSLQPHVRPGDFVVVDQFVDRTTGRISTFYDGPITTHISGAEPYCPTLRGLAIATARRLGLPVRESGTVVVIQGPRFSTRAESTWFRNQGWEVINMTQFPECVLARELEICYTNISLITDYDVGVEGDPSVEPVTHDEVIRQFQANIGRLRELILTMIPAILSERTCLCATALRGARF